MRDILTELLDKYSVGYLAEPAATNLPKSKSVPAENNKTFYFDVGQNDRGVFLRVTEVCSALFQLFTRNIIVKKCV